MRNHIVFAKYLRRFTAISKARDEKRKNDTTTTGDDSVDSHKREFLESQFHEDEYRALEQKIISAAKLGEYEVEVMIFPAAYCTDGGRAINNYEKNWPETLQGKAQNLYSIWKERGKPYGYALKVKILTYPKGFIGDVSLSIDWS